MDKITERELDDVADKAGSYDLALKRLGMSWSDVIRDDGTSLAEASNIGTKVDSAIVGPSVDLDDRATHLGIASSEYQLASDADDLIQGLITNSDPKGELNQMVNVQEFHERNGESAFLRAFGSRALFEAGYDLRRDAHEQLDKFIKSDKICS